MKFSIFTTTKNKQHTFARYLGKSHSNIQTASWIAAFIPAIEKRPSSWMGREYSTGLGETSQLCACYATTTCQDCVCVHGDWPAGAKGSQSNHRQEGIISKTSLSAGFSGLNLFYWPAVGLKEGFNGACKALHKEEKFNNKVWQNTVSIRGT